MALIRVNGAQLHHEVRGVGPPVLLIIIGLMQASAAARLGLATSGMKSRAQRGCAKLKELLDACCEIEFAPPRRSQQLPATPGSLHCRTATPVLPRR